MPWLICTDRVFAGRSIRTPHEGVEIWWMRPGFQQALDSARLAGGLPGRLIKLILSSWVPFILSDITVGHLSFAGETALTQDCLVHSLLLRLWGKVISPRPCTYAAGWLRLRRNTIICGLRGSAKGDSTFQPPCNSGIGVPMTP
jgi:hypothetical protein